MNINVDKVKIFVTVPTDDLERLRDSVCQAGAGIIGNYKYCTYSTSGVGTFIPQEGSNPHIGSQGKLEYVEEEKLEFICDINEVKNVLKAIRDNHPYEEPAIDIVPLISEEYFK